MRPPERYPPDDPQEWLNRARSNLALAETCAAGVYLEDLCFEAQQAAEKAIKSVMVRRAVEYPYVHDLAHGKCSRMRSIPVALRGSRSQAILPRERRNASGPKTSRPIRTWTGTVRGASGCFEPA